MIKKATFTSVWDGGYEISTKCKVNTETHEVFDIEVSNGTDGLVNELDGEYVSFDNMEFRAFREDELPDYTLDVCFWYE